MLYVLDIALAYPGRSEQLAALTEELGLSTKQLRMYDRFFGFENFQCDHDESLETLVGRAASEVLSRNPESDLQLSHVVHCHTLMSTCIFDGRTSPVLAPFADRGLEVLSATMNHCATGVSMLGVLDKILSPGQTGLILIGEKAFHPAIRVIENTTVMGEAAVAVLVGRTLGPYEVVGSFVQHDTRFWCNTGLVGENYLDGFDTAYLGFASSGLQNAMRRFGCGFDDIRYIMPHNVNMPSWYQIAHETGLDRDKIQLSTLGRYGHCFGADPFINLRHAAESGDLDPADHVLLFSIGLGATASCALLRVN